MSNVEILLSFISFMLLMIWWYLRMIYLKIEYGSIYDSTKAVNCYGENLTDAIQNSFVRGQRGIATWNE